jgi:Domain of unknown function (DUF4384)
MLVSLLLLASPLLVPPLHANARTDDPPVKVWFNSDGDYGFADRAKVYAKAAENGYLIVLRADAAGRVRVLFPLDPTDDQRITAGKKYELKGRGGREAFIADDTSGHGIVLAAISSSPFQVDRFAREGHWDNRLLSQPQERDDPETLLRALVEQMTPAGERLLYSVATYVVSERYTRASYVDPNVAYWGYDPWWGYRARFGFGPRYWGWYRPWF